MGYDIAHPYRVAVREGDLVAVSGRLGADPPGVIVPGGFEAEMRQALANLTEALAEVGAEPRDVVKVTVYLTDMDDRDAMNVLFSEYFPTRPPARSCIGVASLPYGGCVELDTLAVVGGGSRTGD